MVELWESKDPGSHQTLKANKTKVDDDENESEDCCPTPNCSCLEENNLSPGAVGDRFLGLCLVSVQDLMSTLSQKHIVSLQGRPFQDDSVLKWTISLKVSRLFLVAIISLTKSKSFICHLRLLRLPLTYTTYIVDNKSKVQSKDSF